MSWDISLLNFFNRELAHPWLDGYMVFATIWGLPLLPVTCFALLRRTQPALGKHILIAVGAALAATLLFYYMAMRPRPLDVRLLLPAPPLPSFPSGHTAVSFTVVAIVLLRMVQIHPWRAPGRILVGCSLLVLGALSVAGSRIYLGHHYPSDVLGGVVLGSAIGAAVHGLMLADRSWTQRLRWLLWPQIAVVFLVSQMAYLNLLPTAWLGWPLADKILHFVLFGAVAFWLNFWFRGRRTEIAGLKLPLAVAMPLAFALVEEAFQAWSPLRTASLADLGADGAGMWLFYALSERLQKDDKSRA